MQTSTLDRTVKTIRCITEPDDGYPPGIEATFVIDPSEKTLSIDIDGEAMSYQWTNIGDNTPAGFYQFLQKLSRSYLLGKLSNQTVFSLEDTVAALCRLRPELKGEIRQLRPTSSDQQFAAEYLALSGTHTDDLEAIVMKYPARHRDAVNLFMDIVRPQLKQFAIPEADLVILYGGLAVSKRQLASWVSALNPDKTYIIVPLDEPKDATLGIMDLEVYNRLTAGDGWDYAQLMTSLDDYLVEYGADAFNQTHILNGVSVCMLHVPAAD